MTQSQMQYSFNAGEWAPALNARVDLAKYRSAAALLLNYFVDYRGGASTRPGTKYILRARDSDNPVRLIPFQASVNVGYILEFGEAYIRFYFDGAPVLETAKNITAITNANPGVITSVGHGYAVDDWIYIESVGGMTQLNGKYFIVNTVPTADTLTIKDLYGTVINTTTYGVYTAGGTMKRVYTIVSPYAADDLAQVKFAQNVSQMILCHPDYPPQVLTLISATNWTILPITFGTTVTTPTGLNATDTLGAGTWNYGHVVTSVDANGQESAPTSVATTVNRALVTTNPGTIVLTWNAVAGAVSYNVYKTWKGNSGVPNSDDPYGFIANTERASYRDSADIDPDFSIRPPIAQNPFEGAGIASVTVTAAGTYTSVPSVTLSGGTPTFVGTVAAILQVTGTPTVAAGGAGYVVGDRVTFSNGVVLVVATVAAGAVATWQPITDPNANPGSVSTGSTPANPVAQTGTSGAGAGATANLTWGVGQVVVTFPGSGYDSAPTVTFSAGAATATAVLQPDSNGYPAVPTFFQQRLVLAGSDGAPQAFFMSQPASYFNYDTYFPVQPDSSISAQLVSNQLNSIKAMIPQAAGLLILTDKASWVVNGGSVGAPVAPDTISATAQSFNGASDVPPIVANFDVLYVQAKNSIVRDSSFDFYRNVYTGTDISVLSSHLFYGYQVLEWCWAEEPFKIVWAVRDDGTLLSLTFMKEQEFVGWTHSTTGASGLFKSTATVTEETDDAGIIDAVYFVVERTINSQTVKYIERLAERIFPDGATSAWCVDAGLQYSGAAATSFTGGEHLAGVTVTGLADGTVIPPFTMPANGNFTLAAAASVVTVGIGYNCDLQTLGLDMGEPTVQGKDKKISDVVVRVADTLGLQIGSTFDDLVAMKDLVMGSVGSMTNEIVTDLVTGDAKTILDPKYQVPGQYCIRQSKPLPASILGVIPTIVLGDTPDARKSR